MYDQTLLVVAIVLYSLSLLLLWQKRVSFAILILFFAALILRYWSSSLFPYLQDWDERYHALVAKNLAHHMLMPTLFENPLLPPVGDDWSQMHVWLHKQPLFLWQMALSIKLFGANETAVRLPSILLSSLLVPIIYRIGTLVFDCKSSAKSELLNV